ncbi:DNA alkylation repair enzyme [Holospora obtusa F1]|uniref:DNA alkylation repair enzyme n=1 Tax=Holospora obtusa F1 TaxID=1399147 RepID=W6TEL2_HOLOB|nr:DNA alkylation repair protein [Holospora obtusa]ETZ07753.1 DNA alkylation repair enzyme [Holospora obtusa F1]
MNLIIRIKDILKNSISVPPHKAAAFFKTGTGHYAEGDEFIGVTVPNLRKIAKNFMILTLDDLKILLMSKINEERLLSLIILTKQYQNEDDQGKERLYQFYMQNLIHVNNWNLVDASAHLIIGAHLWDKDRNSLLSLATSEILWERRISIVSTWYFIRQNELTWTFKIALLLLRDVHDLIHKSAGWMLREAGKRDQAQLVTFLDQHMYAMPRTMLRYAIEKFPEDIRKNYLMKKTI